MDVFARKGSTSRKRIARPRRTHALRMESLEDRRLLAFAAFESTLLRDDNGVPGGIIADNTVAPGETFFVQISAQEFDPGRYGLQVVGLDIEWDASLLDVVEEDFDLPTVVTENLPLYQTGTLDQDGGAIRGLGGGSDRFLRIGRPIGNAVPETFVTVRMQAGDQPGTAGLNLRFGNEKIITAPFALLTPSHLDLDSEQIHIVDSVDSQSSVEGQGITPESQDAPAEQEIITQPAVEVTTAADDSTDSAVVARSDVDPVAESTIDSIRSQTPSESVATDETVSDETVADEPIADEPLVVVAPNLNAEQSPAVENADAEAIDRVMSFDVNQDGVFDFADFGLMNVQASLAQSISESTEPESVTPQDAPVGQVVPRTPSESAKNFATCLAFPDSEDIAANEAWLDSFAAAWIADAEERARRNRRSA